jgi:cobalt-zinc-cadmium efflux system outer membrane protein
MKRWLTGVIFTLAVAIARASSAQTPSFTMEQAVSIALQRNRDVIAARLDIRAAELDRVAAGLYPNPILSYSIGNLPVGAGNPFNTQNGAPANPPFFSQTVHTIGVTEIIDIWSKRGAHIRSADRGIEVKRLEVADALREIVHAVRSAFADVLREQSERQLSRDMRDRYADTVRLSRARFTAGEISEADFRKIELEGLKYQTDVIDAEAEYDAAREKLAALMGLASSTEVPEPLLAEDTTDGQLSVPDLIREALEHRPDALAVQRGRAFAEANLGSAKRDALPDIAFGISYTHSEFLVSGDNPNVFGASVSLPIPLFDRNQANIGRAELDIRRTANDAERIALEVRHDVTDTVRRVERAKTLLAVFEGGMLDRADNALRVAERSYKAGAISLLELLEAQRTFLETRAQYLRAQYDHRQSQVDLKSALGSDSLP